MKKIHNNLSFHSDSYLDWLHTCGELDLKINRLWHGGGVLKTLEKDLRSAGIAVSYGSSSVYVDERTRMRRHTGKRNRANRFMGTSCKSEVNCC